MSKKDAKPGVEETMAEIDAMYGDGTIGKMGKARHADVKVVSTGITSLDLALDCGGLPLGRIVELFGPESSGKSTLAMHVVAEAQAQGLECAYVDTEHAVDPFYAKAIGVDVDELWLSQPDNGEQALTIVEKCCDSGGIGVVVIDSVATLTPRAEIEGEMGEAHVGLMARMMSQGLRKLNGTAYRNGTMLLFINQLREKIGVMYGSPEVTPGGRALKFYSSVRLDVRRKETMKVEGEAAANRTLVKVVKNKVGRPYGQAEFEIQFGEGVDKTKDLINVATELGIVVRSGAWYATAEGEKIGQGLEKSKQALNENPELLALIRKSVQEGIDAE